MQNSWIRRRMRRGRREYVPTAWWTKFTFRRTLDNLDLFKSSLPVFNLRGHEAVSSLSGGTMTVWILMVMILYASIKFAHLLSRHNPNISSHKQQYYFDSSQVLDLKQEDLRFAFSVEGFLDGKVKDDPTYVKYLVRLFGKKDGEFYETILDYHVCSAEELDLFAEPSRDTASENSRASPLMKYIDNEDKHLFCLDWDHLEDGLISVWGVENDDNY